MPGSSPGMTAEWAVPSPRPLDLHAILHLRKFRAESLSVAEIRKTLVMRVRPQHPAGMLDRAPVNLGARRHLARKRDRAIGVGAIGAIDLLDDVEIGEMVAVEHQVIAAAHLWNPVDRKADRLIRHDPDVEQRDRDDQSEEHTSELQSPCNL